MSVIQYPKSLDSDDVHVWNNEAFDNGESEGSAAIKLSWSSVKPSSITLSQSFESDSTTKENESPSILEIESLLSKTSLASVKPLRANSNIPNTQRTPASKTSSLGWKIPQNPKSFCPVKENIPLERTLDSEIEEIEREINRLSSRLESLRFEKARTNTKSMEKRGKIVAAKFKDPPKQSIKSCDEQSKNEESMCLSAKLKTPRRGVSMGPAEIVKGARRGISLGPMEIYSATKLKQLDKQDTTPLPSSSSRRKSCYWKLQDIDELRVAKERGKASSLSPKSRAKTASKVQAPRQAVTTIGSKKAVKKDDGVISSIQPKKLFTKDGEKSATAKKPLKSGRVVASRYNQTPNGGNSAARKELRKRSLPDNEEDFKKSERKRVSLAGRCQGLKQPAVGKRVNRYIEMPSEVAIQKNLDHPLTSVSKMLDGVPKVKTIRFLDESPRDSGPAKRVAELVERKSCFNMDNADIDDEVEELVCLGVNFTEEQMTKEYPKIRVLRGSDESPRDSGAAKKVSQLLGRKSLFKDDDDNDDDEIPVFSLEEEDGEEN